MIKYDPRLNQELTRTVKNFNSKVRRLEGRGLSNLPQTVSLTQIKEEFTDRRRLRSYLNDLRKFSVRGVEEAMKTEGGLTLSRWEYAIRKREQSTTKRRITAEAKAIAARDYLYKARAAERLRNLEAKYLWLSENPISKLDETSLKTFNKIVGEMTPDLAKDLTFYQNFVAWINDLSQMGIPHSARARALEAIQVLTPAQLATAYRFEPILQDIKTAYMDYKNHMISYDDVLELLNTISEYGNYLKQNYG